MHLLDIDLDAAVANCKGSTQGPQTVVATDLTRLASIIGNATQSQRWFMDEHLHTFAIWHRHDVMSGEVWHIDAHHDCYGATDHRVWRTVARPQHPNCPSITSATYLLAAWRVGMVKRIVWVIPSWLPEASAAKSLRREMGPAWRHMDITQLNSLPTTKWAHVTVAWSRRWIDLELQHAVSHVIPKSAVEAVASGRNFIQF
jgi:hypothetical protein